MIELLQGTSSRRIHTHVSKIGSGRITELYNPCKSQMKGVLCWLSIHPPQKKKQPWLDLFHTAFNLRISRQVHIDQELQGGNSLRTIPWNK